MNIKDMVKDNKKVFFKYFRENVFYYETECGFVFPVPLEDIGNATLQNEDKALFFMRYIRKHVSFLENAN